MKKLILRNRFTLLLTVLASYLLVVAIEGKLTGREPGFNNIENPYFDLELNNVQQLSDESRDQVLSGLGF